MYPQQKKPAGHKQQDTVIPMQQRGSGLAVGSMALLLMLLLLLLNGCGGTAQVPAQKIVVVGTAAEMTQKRDATRSRKNRQHTGVLHSKHINGVAVADDAPHPYILSSGHILVDINQLGSVQVAMHENLQGKVSDVVPASFHNSDPTVVSAVRPDPAHPNAVLLTMTGKKGNSFITSFDPSGNAISKFMVLAAQPKEDVLVISDPDIHPTLCTIGQVSGGEVVCFFETSTDFDQGNSGVNFSVDAYLSQAPNTVILFEDSVASKIAALDVASKRAIYFEGIDTLFIVRRGNNNQARLRTFSGGFNKPVLRKTERNALYIERVATQKEFNDYIDYGGLLTSSPLRNAEQTDVAAHDITPDRPAKGELTAVVLQDGSRHTVTEANLLGVVNGDRSKIRQHVYTLRQPGQLASESPLTCTITGDATHGVPSISFTSFHSNASARLSGQTAWNGGKPNIALDLNPYANLGGQVEVKSGAGAHVGCKIELLHVPISEWGVPILGKIKLGVPISVATEFGVEGSGKAVLVTPKFHISARNTPNAPGKVGVSYTPSGGFKTDFDMETSIAKNRLGLAQGTDVGKSSAQAKIGMELGTGIQMALELTAKVNAWLFKVEVDAEAANVLLGIKTKGEYTIDYAKGTSKKVSSESEAGIGVFFEVAPTISVKTSFFSLSYNLFDLDVKPLWIYKFPFSEEPEEALEPAEKSFSMAFGGCFLNSSCNEIPASAFSPIRVTGTYSSELIAFQRPNISEKPNSGFRYYYTYTDKPTGQIRKSQLPVTIEPDGSLKIQKTGITDIVQEYIVSDSIQINYQLNNFSFFGTGCRFWHGSTAVTSIPANECSIY